MCHKNRRVVASGRIPAAKAVQPPNHRSMLVEDKKGAMKWGCIGTCFSNESTGLILALSRVEDTLNLPRIAPTTTTTDNRRGKHG